MRHTTIRSKGIWAMMLMFSALNAQAIIVQLTDLHTMAKRSDVVIHGYVGQQTVSTDKYGRLITISEVAVIDGLYGAKNGDIINIYQVGGEKDGIVAPLIGGQSFSPAQELIFFGLRAGGNFVSIGGGQGKLDIDDKGQVTEDLGNVEVINPKNPSALFKPSPLSYTGVELFKNELREMLKSR